MIDRRQDRKTADQISEALRMQRAFGAPAGAAFLRQRQIADELARDVLGGRYERRQDAGRER